MDASNLPNPMASSMMVLQPCDVVVQFVCTFMYGGINDEAQCMLGGWRMIVCLRCKCLKTLAIFMECGMKNKSCSILLGFVV